MKTKWVLLLVLISAATLLTACEEQITSYIPPNGAKELNIQVGGDADGETLITVQTNNGPMEFLADKTTWHYDVSEGGTEYVIKQVGIMGADLYYIHLPKSKAPKP